MPEPEKYDKKNIKAFDILKEAITQIRAIRKEKNIPNKDELELFINASGKEYDRHFEPVLMKMANLSKITSIDHKISGTEAFRILSSEFYVKTGLQIDIKAEIKKLNEELEYTKGFLSTVKQKLSNERFVNSAPEKVVAMERKKQADAEAKIKAIEERLAGMKGK